MKLLESFPGLLDEKEFLLIAGSIESQSEHPLGKAVVRAAQEVVELKPVSEFTSKAGRGVQAKFDGHTYDIGGPAMLRENNFSIPENLQSEVDHYKQRGASILYVVQNKNVIGAVALEDKIRPESSQAVKLLEQLGVKTVMMTGDAKQVAEAVSKDVGIKEVLAEVLPEDKDKKVVELTEQGKKSRYGRRWG
ncbi:MAG: HAD-IC family P-type ATPase [Acidimicrobiia bacterium]